MEFVRLVARYDLVIDRSNLEGSSEVTGVRLRNSAADVFPFSTRPATATLDGDISTISDYNASMQDPLSHFICMKIFREIFAGQQRPVGQNSR